MVSWSNFNKKKKTNFRHARAVTIFNTWLVKWPIKWFPHPTIKKNNSSKISFIPALIRKRQGARYIHQPRDKPHAEQSRGNVQEDKAQKGYIADR